MPTYRRNSRQWAQARLDELNQIKRVTGKNTERELQEHSELIEGLLAGIYPDDPNPGVFGGGIGSCGADDFGLVRDMDKLITRENLAIIKTSAAGAVASTRYHSCTDVHIATRALLEDVIFPMADRCEELLERVAFLERALEQAVDHSAIRIEKYGLGGMETERIHATLHFSDHNNVSRYPDLAAYLRSKSAPEGQAGGVGAVGTGGEVGGGK